MQRVWPYLCVKMSIHLICSRMEEHQRLRSHSMTGRPRSLCPMAALLFYVTLPLSNNYSKMKLCNRLRNFSKRRTTSLCKRRSRNFLQSMMMSLSRFLNLPEIRTRFSNNRYHLSCKRKSCVVSMVARVAHRRNPKF